VSQGILDLVSLAATAVFALPVAAFGLLKLSGPEPHVGVALLVVAGLMFAFESYVTTPGDLPGRVAEGAVDLVLPNEDDEE
jgi:hypothetical protein